RRQQPRGPHAQRLADEDGDRDHQRRRDHRRTTGRRSAAGGGHDQGRVPRLLMPRVRVLHTGGTLMMRSEGGAPLTPDVYGRDLVAELPSLARIAELETRILFTMDSGDMQPAEWSAIAREVH